MLAWIIALKLPELIDLLANTRVFSPNITGKIIGLVMLCWYGDRVAESMVAAAKMTRSTQQVSARIAGGE